MSHYERLRKRLGASITFLPDKPEENLDSTLRALWFAAKGTPMSAQLALAHELQDLSTDELRICEELIEQRLSGVPLAHITGRQQFMGMEMLVGPDALVPRKETELLAESAVTLAAEAAADSAVVTAIDVCTGSGNVALAIARHVPAARVFAADMSDAAVELARRNAEHLQLADRVVFSTGDLLSPFESPEFFGRVDLLTCNPPYVASINVSRMPDEIAAHEPRLAFDGGALGVGILIRLIQQAPRFLRDGGWLAFEVGLGQGPPIVKRLAATPAYKEVRTAQDAAGAIRTVMGRC